MESGLLRHWTLRAARRNTRIDVWSHFEDHRRELESIDAYAVPCIFGTRRTQIVSQIQRETSVYMSAERFDYIIRCRDSVAFCLPIFPEFGFTTKTKSTLHFQKRFALFFSAKLRLDFPRTSIAGVAN